MVPVRSTLVLLESKKVFKKALLNRLFIEAMLQLFFFTNW